MRQIANPLPMTMARPRASIICASRRSKPKMSATGATLPARPG